MKPLGVVAAALGLGLLVALGTWGAPVVAAPVRIGTNRWIGYEPLHAAAAEGKLPSHLQLVEYVSATQVLRAFENRDIDAAAVTLDEALSLSASTRDVALVAVLDVSHGGDAVIARPPRASLDQLAGARIAVEDTAVGHLMLRRALDRAHLSRDQVQVISLPVNDHVVKWDAGLDAVVTFEPIRSRLLALGGVEVFSSRDIPGEIVDVLVVRRSSLAARPTVRAELTRACFQARGWALSEPARFAGRAALRLKVTESEVSAQLEGVRLPTEEESQAQLRGALLETAKSTLSFVQGPGAPTEADARALFDQEGS
ncbi:MAG: ABC transporter substrate-binding protein [Myxococcaceae bacterium]|nr:ABC transporter substrate-binding protein [Myxococcaceae bacterium]